MSKTLLHKLFGTGRIPKRVRPTLAEENIVVFDEGIGGSVTFHNYRAPGKWFGLRRVWFTGCLAATSTRLVAFVYSREIINLTFADPRFACMTITAGPGPLLCIAFDVQAFTPERSGRVEYRFKTEHATAFVQCMTRRA